jgi:hypothetical protein
MPQRHLPSSETTVNHFNDFLLKLKPREDCAERNQLLRREAKMWRHCVERVTNFFVWPSAAIKWTTKFRLLSSERRQGTTCNRKQQQWVLCHRQMWCREHYAIFHLRWIKPWRNLCLLFVYSSPPHRHRHSYSVSNFNTVVYCTWQNRPDE